MPFIPLHDDNPTVITPYVSYGLLALNVLIFFWQVGQGPDGFEQAVLAFGATPAALFGGPELAAGAPASGSWITLVTSMFLHGDIMHLGSNMLYLWIFANNVEDAMGHGRFMVFYLMCGMIAALVHALIEPASTVPMIGASGAISGVLGAYLLLHPRARILVVVVFPIVLRLPAWLVLGVWFLGQGLSVLATGAAGGGIAWFAHIGGFVTGMALMVPFRRPDVVLLDRNRPPARHDPGPRGRWRRGPWG